MVVILEVVVRCREGLVEDARSLCLKLDGHLTLDTRHSRRRCGGSSARRNVGPGSELFVGYNHFTPTQVGCIDDSM